MNGKRADSGDNHGGEHFDPGIAALFNEANETSRSLDAETAFVTRGRVEGRVTARHAAITSCAA